MQKIGKKAKQWQKDRVVVIKDAIISGKITIVDGEIQGICCDCKKWRPLDPDHRKKRSQGGSNDSSNIDWPCRECHGKRDQGGDPMQKKEKSSKKPEWMTPHYCKKCGQRVQTFLCSNCGKPSV